MSVGAGKDGPSEMTFDGGVELDGGFNKQHEPTGDAVLQCPSCGLFPFGAAVGGQCPDCGTELEVTALDPPALAEAPETEEDWGE